MKFFAYLALVGSAAALRLTQHQRPSLVEMSHQQTNIRHVLANLKDLPDKETAEKWIKSELEKDGSITKDEAKAALEGWEKETGNKISKEEWDMLEDGFEVMDLDDDGKITEAEIECIMGDKDKCPKDVSVPHITEEQWKDIEEYITEAFEDGKLTWKECKKGMKLFEEKYGKVDKEIKDFLKSMFKVADANGDKAVTLEELEAFAAKYSD